MTDAHIRIEQLMAYQLGALDDDERQLIAEKLRNDPDWQAANAEARKLLDGLVASDAELTAPPGLADRAIAQIRAQGPPARPFRFTPRIAVAVLVFLLLPVVYRSRMRFSGPPPVAAVWNAEPQLASGAPYAPFLLVQEAHTGEPLEGVTLALTLKSAQGKPALLGSGVTGASGMVEGPSWRVPDLPAGDYELRARLTDAGGAELAELSRQVKLTRPIRLVLTSDRLQARPGETIRARVLLQQEATGKPLGEQAVAIELFDPTGNRIAREERRTSRFGLAWASFPLDELAREGGYRLRVQSGGRAQEQTVQVKQYQLPAFRVQLTLDRRWFGSDAPVSGRVQVSTFEGYPLEVTGRIRLLGAEGKPVASAPLALQSGSRGLFRLQGKDGAARLEVELSDRAGRRVRVERPLLISDTGLVLTAVAESGELIQGLNNRVYLVARTLDGQPVSTKLKVQRRGRAASFVSTDEHGVAVWTLSNPSPPAELIELNGQPVSLRVRAQGELRLRTDRAVVEAGGALKIKLRSTRTEGVVALALRQDGRPLATAAVRLRAGVAEATLTVPGGISGMLTVEALLPRKDTRTWRDSRVVSVVGSRELKVHAVCDREQYRPGETAQLSFQVTDSAGAGVVAAVSVVAVDEALLALTGRHPGLAQALQASGINILRLPGSPLDPAAYGPADGATPVAHAALAAVQPRTAAGVKKYLQELVQRGVMEQDAASEMIAGVQSADADQRHRIAEIWKEMGVYEQLKGLIGPDGLAAEDSLFDTAAQRREEISASRRQAADEATQWGVVLVGLLIALWVLCWAWSVRRMMGGVPLITLAFTLLGFTGVSVGEGYPVLSTWVLAGLLVATHGLLLMRASQLGSTSESFFAVTICTDLVLMMSLVAAPLFLLLVLVGLALQVSAMLLPGKRKASSCLELILVGVVLLVVAAMLFPVLNRVKSSGSSIGRPAKELGFALLLSKENRTPDETTLSGVPDAPPRVRWNFPETLIFAPQIITDAQGRATLRAPVADALTTWRVQVDAIGATGGVAWTVLPLVVTQPFSVDMTLPSDVTAGDELVVPLVVSNHGGVARRVALALKVSGATILDGAERLLEVPPRSVRAAAIRVRFDRIGRASLTVTAKAGAEQDAIRRTLPVRPDGQPLAVSASAQISGEQTLWIELPSDVIPGSLRGQLRLHRGPLSPLLDGLDSMLREPHGCFEQASSSAYPNLMVLDYLERSGSGSGKVARRARRLVAQGYQRLLRFEVDGKSGGFSLFGQAPASPWLTAYGLMQFQDMARVHPVDPALLQRMRRWLVRQIGTDGSIPGRGDLIASTAYLACALGKRTPAKTLKFLREHWDQISRDPFLCALVAKATAASSPPLARKSRAALVRMARVKGGRAWLPATQSLAWGYGRVAVNEATALAVIALIDAGEQPELVRKMLAGLHAAVEPGGGWGSTHATVSVLKALVRQADQRHDGPVHVQLELNGRPLKSIDLPAGRSPVAVALPLALKAGRSKLRIRVSGGVVLARVTGRAYLPWGSSNARPGKAPFELAVRYSATRVKQHQSVRGTLTLTAVGRTALVPMVGWGLPAGFVPLTSDLDQLRAKGSISRWELSGRMLRLYLPDCAPRRMLQLDVRFVATARGLLKCPAGRVYEYYQRHEARPLPGPRFTVD